MNQVNVNTTPNMNPGMNQAPMGQPGMMPRKSRMPMVILVIVIVVLAVLGFLFRDKLGMKSAEKLSGYQAVFLTNGQVYFGKLSNAGSSYVTLKDIYYLQVNQQLQPGQDAAAAQAEAAANPQLSLVKLGNELHGPVDAMQINRDQILFFEDLKSDGKVAEAIASYKKDGATAATPNTDGTAKQAPTNTTPAPTGTGTQQQVPVVK